MTRHEMDIKTQVERAIDAPVETAESFKARVARNIDASIEESGFSGAEVARRLGLNEKTVRRWRSGEATPNIERLAELAAVVGSKDVVAFYAEPYRKAAA